MNDELRPGHAPERLSDLATEIAGLIANRLSQTDAGADLLAARPKCPPGKLCCFTGYRCSDFWCEGGFRCSKNFSHLQVDHF